MSSRSPSPSSHPILRSVPQKADVALIPQESRRARYSSMHSMMESNIARLEVWLVSIRVFPLERSYLICASSWWRRRNIPCSPGGIVRMEAHAGHQLGQGRSGPSGDGREAIVCKVSIDTGDCGGESICAYAGLVGPAVGLRRLFWAISRQRLAAGVTMCNRRRCHQMGLAWREYTCKWLESVIGGRVPSLLAPTERTDAGMRTPPPAFSGSCFTISDGQTPD